MWSQRASRAELRGFYAGLVASAGRLRNQPAGNSFEIRLEGAFEAIPREMFLPPGPWHVATQAGQYIETPSTDVSYLYQDVLVAIDKDRQINNGQPSYHARLMSLAAPMPGEIVVHIGAGTGYYTAILAMLLAPGGRVEAFEIDARFAAAARRNLEAFEGVIVTEGDATKLAIPPAHVVYINAGVRSPPAHWLNALRPGGRMVLPWCPARDVAIALLIERTAAGFRVDPTMAIRIIPCAGAFAASPDDQPPSRDAAWATRSLHLMAERAPDTTLTAAYRDVWFSSDDLGPMTR